MPTADWIVDVCSVKPGDVVAVFGYGPVGLLARRSAFFIVTMGCGKTIRRLAGLNPNIVITGHGKPLSGKELEQQLNELSRDFTTDFVPSHDTMWRTLYRWLHLHWYRRFFYNFQYRQGL